MPIGSQDSDAPFKCSDSLRGTVTYLPISFTHSNSFSTDMFSMGITLQEIVLGKRYYNWGNGKPVEIHL